MTRSAWESLPHVLELSEGPPGCSGVVREALPDVREWSGGPRE